MEMTLELVFSFLKFLEFFLKDALQLFRILTFQAPAQQIGRTHLTNSSAICILWSWHLKG